MNYWPRWINAITNATAHLSLMEMGAYDRLLDHYYKSEQPLPSLDDCCRIVRAMSKPEREAVARVLRDFFTQTGAGYTQQRADEEIQMARPKIEAARANGLRGGRPKRTQEKPSGFPAGTHDEPKSKTPHPHSSSLRSEQTPPPPKGGAFARFWNAWPKSPRKVAKEQCARKWETKGCEAIAEQVIAAVEAAKGSAGWTKNGGEFIPSPLVWLNQARWEAPTDTEAAADYEESAWQESRSGIERKGESLGLGKWDEYAAQTGRGEPFAAYSARVMRAAGIDVRAVA